MRRTILLLVLLLSTAAARASWTPLNIGPVVDADFYTAESGLIVRTDTLWRYDHGDLSKNPAPHKLTQIAIADSDIAWGVAEGRLYRATRGWTSWSVIGDSINPTIVGVIGKSALIQASGVVSIALADTIVDVQGITGDQLLKVEAITPTIAVAIGTNYLYRTTNAGATWQQLSATLRGATGLFADRAHNLFYMSGPLRVSSNYGLNWTAVPPPPQFPGDPLGGPIAGAHDCSGIYYLLPKSSSGDYFRGGPDGLFYDLGANAPGVRTPPRTWVFNGGAVVLQLVGGFPGGEINASFDGIDGSMQDSVHMFIIATADTLRLNYCSHRTDTLRITLRSSTCLPIPIDSIHVEHATGTLKRMAVGKTLTGDSLVVKSTYTARALGLDTILLRVWMHPGAGRAYRESIYYTAIASTAGGPAKLLSTASIDFGRVPIDTIVTRQLTIGNSGCDDLRIDSIVSTNPALFALTLPTLPLYVRSGDSVRMAVSYHPARKGQDLESIEIGTSGGHRFITVTGAVSVSGVARAPSVQALQIAPNPASGRVTLEIPSAADYTLASLTGEIVGSGRLESGKNILRLDAIASGVYLLHVAGYAAARIVIVR